MKGRRRDLLKQKVADGLASNPTGIRIQQQLVTSPQHQQRRRQELHLQKQQELLQQQLDKFEAEERGNKQVHTAKEKMHV